MPDRQPAVTPPEVVSRKKARYPRAALRAARGGVAAAEIQVDETGVTRAPMIVKSSGVLGLDVEAMEVLREWRFKPAERDGRPISIWYTLTVTFEIE